MRLKTLLNENITNEFVKFVVTELELESLPTKIKFVGSDYSKENMTFGTYNVQTDEIIIVKGNRHIADVLRTLAHEMVHHKQRQAGKDMNGEDGSPLENEANAKAGELMRKFRYVRPELYQER
jgi:Zn-dependent peptidase ImmA (M78 family)